MSATGRFAGKVAVVTGAGSGIGAATAALLARDGARVWFADLDKAAAAREADRADGARAAKLDVTTAESWDDLTRRVRAEGGWDILVNAAGIGRGGGAADVMDATLEGWRTVFAVNVEGTLLGCQAAMREMNGGSSSIVNIASTAGIAPSPALAAYGASKAAVIQLTCSVAAACALRGLAIRCNSVAPGMADTPLTQGMSDTYRAAWIEQIPAGRFAQPAEIAAVIAFLASDDAAYVSGSCHRVDGGLLTRPIVR